MNCHKCRRHLGACCWTDAQWQLKQSNVGGRDECRECWKRGPTSEDWREVDDMAAKLKALSYKNCDLGYENCLASLVGEMDSAGRRKSWSYRGVLPVRCRTDYITKPSRRTFDPGNYVYAYVIRRLGRM